MNIIKIGFTTWCAGGLLAVGSLLFLRMDYFYYGAILSFIGAAMLIVGMVVEIWRDLFS